MILREMRLGTCCLVKRKSNRRRLESRMYGSEHTKNYECARGTVVDVVYAVMIFSRLYEFFVASQLTCVFFNVP